ncbi:MAG: helix-turn-helix domain containing protein [Erysipelotrichaceae bacterium]|nr:helix-turn-helix domain containing protein [Erysipelotrichaceae bacterium]
MVSRKTTKEERIKIVQYCIEHNSNYNKTAELYDVTFEEVFNWVKNFCTNGIDGLDDDKVNDKLNITRLNNEKEYLEGKLDETQLEKRLLLKVQEIEAREKVSKKKNNQKKERHKKKKH